jgi:hypothetical protein
MPTLLVNLHVLFILTALFMIASLAEAQPPLLRQSPCTVDTDFWKDVIFSGLL